VIFRELQFFSQAKIPHSIRNDKSEGPALTPLSPDLGIAKVFKYNSLHEINQTDSMPVPRARALFVAI